MQLHHRAIARHSTTLTQETIDSSSPGFMHTMLIHDPFICQNISSYRAQHKLRYHQGERCINPNPMVPGDAQRRIEQILLGITYVSLLFHIDYCLTPAH